MQKSKIGKFSIFNSLDIKLKFLMSWIELTQFSVESSRVKLKICSIQLKSSWKCEQLNFESSWKCEQLNFESSWIQNVNSKLNSTISLITRSNQRCFWMNKTLLQRDSSKNWMIRCLILFRSSISLTHSIN